MRGDRTWSEHPFVRANGRFIFFIFCVFCIFGYLIWGLMNLQLFASDEYTNKAVSHRTTTIPLRGSRGMITDADSVILAQDELIYNVTFYRDASQNTTKMYKTYSDTIAQTISIIEKNRGTLSVSFVIERDPETGEWRFNFGSGVSDAVLETREKQWRGNHYLGEVENPTAESVIKKLKERYQLSDDMDEALMLKIMAVYSEMQMNLFNSQPIVIAKDVAYETVIEVETRSMLLPGMEIAVGTKRVYPRSNLAAQLIGYTGAIPSAEMWSDLKAKGYSYSDTIGRDGIESSMEDWLTQNSSLRQGSRTVERDRVGKVTREISYTEPQNGNNVKLTIIASYQQQAERAIANNVKSTRDIQENKMVNPKWLEDSKEDILDRNWEKYPLKLAEHGTLMVIDMEGRVLADANYPTYDLNALVSGGKQAKEILSDPRGLLMNYSIHARGTPGSIFKMVTGTGAMIEGLLSTTEMISDMGPYTRYEQEPSKAPRCWATEAIRKNDHQNQTIVQGLKNSCNYFFYELGSRLFENGDKLYKYASLFGLTSKTGIDLPGELRSVVGTQTTLYDQTKAMGEAYQDTSIPIIVFNSLKTHLSNFGASRNIIYDDERLNRCVKRLMDMAVNTPQSETVWVQNMRSILMEELNMTKEMVYLRAVIGDAYNFLNDIKWGGSYSIQTAIGQGITVLTPAAVSRYVAAIANGGNVYNLMLVDSIISPDGEVLSQRTPTLVNTLENAQEYLSYIREGMKGVVDESGTAAKYFNGWAYREQICAKTGTAETSKIDLENNAWFVAFAPYDRPEIAVVSFVPNGFSGGEASLAAKEFIEWYMNQKTMRTDEADLPGGNQLAP